MRGVVVRLSNSLSDFTPLDAPSFEEFAVRSFIFREMPGCSRSPSEDPDYLIAFAGLFKLLRRRRDAKHRLRVRDGEGWWQHADGGADRRSAAGEAILRNF